MRTDLMVVMIIILPFQICVSGVCGALGQPVQSLAAVASGSATDSPWLLFQDPTVKVNRHRPRAATQDSAQVSAVRIGGGPTKRAVPTNVLVAPLTYGSMSSSVCENGTLVCTKLQCPVYEPWNPWSSCSASCGRGQITRTRLCQDTEGGPSCDDTMQKKNCDLPSCPGLTWNKY
ncbi:hypothetical protein PFLUV_G00250370 [Perca fluviatilis]|uniref:Uncharacterized protein n=1 Tax=Perca fluviatilis TaxID=8168 RepID=A0A6A5E9S3_PERFL|nr:hypothetical protein PFLUV_G00250370 [Perca fluviatilis]